MIFLKELYLVLVHDTRRPWMNLLTMFSGTRYNHLTISLDPHLHDLYGFVGANDGKVIRCGINHFPDWNCMVLKKEITDDQYQQLQEELWLAWQEKNRYKYHRFGIFFLALVMAPLYRLFHISLPRPLIRWIFNQPEKRTCGSFVGVMLRRAGIEFSPIPEIPGTQNPYLMTCATFRSPEAVGFNLIYEGWTSELSGNKSRTVVVCTQQ